MCSDVYGGVLDVCVVMCIAICMELGMYDSDHQASSWISTGGSTTTAAGADQGPRFCIASSVIPIASLSNIRYIYTQHEKTFNRDNMMVS